ncbi:MAG: hypothetical protein QXG01_06520 [Candidatus Bathyarchaeia archaeon]
MTPMKIMARAIKGLNEDLSVKTSGLEGVLIVSASYRRLTRGY